MLNRLPPIADARWLPYRNDASESVPAFGLLRPTGVTTRQRQTLLTCGMPDTTFHRQYFVNGPLVVPAGGYGQCTADFPAYALYDSGNTPALGEGWGAKPGQWKLFKDYPGFTIAGGADSSLGVVLARGFEVTQLIGKLDGTLSQGSSQTVSVWIGTPGSETDSTINISSCRDWLMKSGATAISSGKKVQIQWINGIWYVVNAECA